MGTQCLRNSNIQRIIQIHCAARALSAEQVMNRLSEMATVNIADFVDEEGRIKKGCVKKFGHLIKSIEGANGVRGPKLELHNALDALDKMARIRRLYADTQVNVNSEGPVEFVLNVSPEDLP